MTRILSIILAGSFLAACDQAINDRYDGLEVVEVVEVIDMRDDEEEPQEVDLFDGEQTSIAGVDIARPNPRPAAMSLTGLSPAETRENPDLETPELQPAGGSETQLASFLLPPVRPRDIPVTEGQRLDISALGLVQPLGERPVNVANTADEDQIRLARLAEEAAAEEARQIALAAQAEEEARLAALSAAQEEARLADAAAREAENAARRAAQEAEARTVAQSSQAAQPAASDAQPTLFTPVAFTAAALNTASQLNRQYAEQGFDLSQVMAGKPVPNLVVQRMPEDMAALGTQDRGLMKEVFIKTVLPLCLRANARVGLERAKYETTPEAARLGDLRQSSHRIVRSLAAKYQVTTAADMLASLSPVPPSLCLAQAIHDSDWGRNEAVQNQNGLFGAWGDSRTDAAIPAPMRGRSDVTNNALVFTNLEAAVDTYVLFLNRHQDLAPFRGRRAQEIAIGQVFNGRAASLFMDGFRPQETDYRDRLLRLINENELDQFDLTRLSGAPLAIAVN